MEEIGNIDIKNPKVVTLDEAIILASNAQREGRKVVTTNGCFDILHVGHVRNLQFARSQGDMLIVGVNSDKSVQNNKGLCHPIIPAQERAEVLASLEPIDYVFIFDTLTPVEWLKMLQPAFHVKGSDRTLDQVVEREVVEKYGGEVVLFPYSDGHSTTAIIKKIQSIDADNAR